MWIRDSTNQITPYLKFIKLDETLRDLVFGVLQVQASFLNYDPYANAFLRPWYAPKKEGQKRGSTSDRVIPSYDPDIVWESKVKYQRTVLESYLNYITSMNWTRSHTFSN
jgi:meiotically up-regulated gene 157 (Mug157) protein